MVSAHYLNSAILPSGLLQLFVEPGCRAFSGQYSNISFPSRVVLALSCSPPHASGESMAKNHRIPAWQGLEGTSVGHLVQAPAKAGSPTEGCTGPCPGGS